MGRPVNKRFLSDHTGAIAVSAYRRVGETEQTGNDDVYISRQRTNNKFTVAETIDHIDAVQLDGSNVHIGTTGSHGLSTGDRIKIEDVGGTTELNEKWFTVTIPGPSELTLDGTNPADFSEYEPGTGRIIGWEENLRLSERPAGSLREGTFAILAHDKFGIVDNVTKIYNRSVVFAGHEKQQWAPEVYDDDDNLVLGPALVNGIEDITLDGTNPVEITTVGPHRLSVDNEVTFENVAGTTELNGNTYKVKAVSDSTSFTLKLQDDTDTDSSDFSAYTSNEGHIERAGKEFGFSDVILTIGQPVKIETVGDHTFKTGDVVDIDNVSGTTELNENSYTITVTGSDTFTLDGTSYNGSNYSEYESGGSASRDAASFAIDDLIADDPDDPIYVETESSASFQTGDVVTLNNLPTVTELNGQTFTVTRVDSRTFGLDGTRFGDYPEYERKDGKVVRPEESRIITHMDLDGPGNVRLYLLEDSTFRPEHDVFVSNSELFNDGGSDQITSRIDARTVEFSRGRSAYTGTYESRGHTRGFIIPARDGAEQRIVGMSRSGTDPVEVRTLYEHGLEDGDYVHLKDLESATELNDKTFKVTKVSDHRFTLNDTDSSQVGFFEGAGQVYPSIGNRSIDDISISGTGVVEVTLSNNFTHKDEDIIRFSSSGGPAVLEDDYDTPISGDYFRIERTGATTFILKDFTAHANDFGRTVHSGNVRIYSLNYVRNIYVHDNEVYYDLMDSASDITDDRLIVKSIVDGGVIFGTGSGTGSHFAGDFENDGDHTIYDINSIYSSGDRTTVQNYTGNTDKVLLFNRYERITGISKADSSDIEVSFYSPSGYSYETGDNVEFAGVQGTTELNGNSYEVTRVDSNTISLNDTDSTSISEFVAEGARIASSTTLPVDGFQRYGNADTTDITIEFEDPHGLSVGDEIIVDNIGLVDEDSLIQGASFLEGPFYFKVETVPNVRSVTLADTTDDDTADAEFEYLRYRPYGQIIRPSANGDISAITTTSGSELQVTFTNTDSKRLFYTGDMVTFNNVAGTTELNSGGPYTVTEGTFDATADTEIVTLDGTDGDDFTTHLSSTGNMIRDIIARNVTAVSWDNTDGYTFTVGSAQFPVGESVRFDYFKPGTGSNPISNINGIAGGDAGFKTITESTGGTSVRISADQWPNAPYDAPINQIGTVAPLEAVNLIQSINVEENTDLEITLEEDSTLVTGGQVYIQGVKEPSLLNDNLYTVTSQGGRTYSLDDTATTDRVNRYQKPQNAIVSDLEKNFIADTNNEERIVHEPEFTNGPLTIKTVKEHTLSANEDFLVDGMLATREDNVSNTGKNQDTTTINVNNTWRNYAQRFRTGSNADGYEMQSASIIFGSDRPSTGEVSLHIRSDSSNNPSGSTLANLVDPSSITAGENKFTLSTPLHLDPDTHYWVEVRRNSGSFQLAGTDSNGEDSTSSDGWQIGNNAHFISSGSWQGLSNSRSLLIKVEASELRLGTDLNGTVQTVQLPFGDYDIIVADHTLDNLHRFIGHRVELRRHSRQEFIDDIEKNSDPTIGPTITFTNNHVFETGDIVTISDVGGFEEIFDGGDDITVVDLGGTQIQLADFPTSLLGSDTYQPTGTIDRAGTTISIRNIVKDGTDPLEIESRNAHGLATGDEVTFTGISGTTELNGNTYTVTRVDDTTFTLDSTDSSNFTDFETAGEADIPAIDVDIKTVELLGSEPVRITTDSNHNLLSGNSITITDVGGTTELNGNDYSVTVIDNDTFILNHTKSSEFSEYVGRGMVTRAGDETVTGVATLPFQDS